MKKKVAFIDEVHPILKKRLELAGFECIDLSKVSKEFIESQIFNYQGIIIRSRFKLDSVFLEKANQLEFIARSGAGMENIDIDYCVQKSIQLFNAPEGNRNAVGEHALGMLLSLFNNLNKGDSEIRNGIWDREGNRGEELDGKTVGIVGFGNNGQAFAKKLRGFDIDLLVYDKYKFNFANEFIQEVEMDSIFEKADVISFHIPQNEETLFLVNSDYLSKFKKEIYLINLARGKIVKTKSLIEFLDKGLIKGACLDVLEFEKTSFENIYSDKGILPIEFKHLLNSDKVILSPHVGGWTKESYFKLSDVLADKILSHIKNGN
jgi:D-3-phosphoglycerate dehydrogenase